MRIGIFGGSFDPCHLEHKKIAKQFIAEQRLSRLYIIPVKNAPHKKNITDARHRFNMLKIAFLGDKNIEISDFEINQKTTNYSYITVEHFAKIHPGAELFFLVGGDSLCEFFNWKNAEKIANLCTVTVANREGYDILNAAEKFEKNYGKKAEILNITGKDISSTEIRVLLEFEMPLEEMIDEKVLAYIIKHKLYSRHRAVIRKSKKYLLGRRYIHTAYTVSEALKLAGEIGCDEEKVFIAATLHDVAKKMTTEQLKNLGFENKENLPKTVTHAYVGVLAAKKLFYINDEDILNAIKFHTTGRPNMSDLEKIIYVADSIEKTRDFPYLEKLRALVYEDFNNGFIECIKYSYEKLRINKDITEISPMTLAAYHYYSESKGDNK